MSQNVPDVFFIPESLNMMKSLKTQKIISSRVKSHCVFDQDRIGFLLTEVIMKERKQKVTKSLRLSEEIIEKINNFSQRTGLSQTKIITSAIENFLSNKGVENE